MFVSILCIFPKSKILVQTFFLPKMEVLFSLGDGTRLLPQCVFCKACCFDDIWVHYERCKSMPEEKKEESSKIYKGVVASAEKDWREFLEQKFEPHHFRKRWESMQEHLPLVLLYFDTCVGGRQTKRLPFGMEARFWFVGRNTHSRVQPANHKDPGEVRCTLSLERIPIHMALVFY